MTVEIYVHDVNELPPLVVSGVSFVLEHRFAVVSSNGTACSFPKLDQLKAHLREEAKAGDVDVAQARIFVFTKEWMQVPHPGI